MTVPVCDISVIRDRVDIIRVLVTRGDYEAAHSEVDRLYHDTLALIRDGKFANSADIAAEALKAELIEFPRHCS